MLTQEQILQIRNQIGLSDVGIQQTTRRQKLATEYDDKQNIQKEEPGYFTRVWNKWKEGAEDIVEGVKEGAEQIESGKPIRGAITGALRTVGEVADQAFTPILEAPGIKQGVDKIGEGLAKVPGITWLASKVDEFSTTNPVLAKDIKNVIDLATLGASKTVEKPVASGIKNVAERTTDTIKGSIDDVVTGTKSQIKGTIPKIKEVINPSPTPIRAAGQVLQGKTKDLASGLQGLSILDTTNIKTFKDLRGKIKNKIIELAQQVDSDLDLDKTITKLKDLVLYKTSNAGKKIKIKPVDEALSNLKELYEKIGDKVNLQNIKELIIKANKNGLTNKEINQLARTYNIEFSSKAFSKTGEQLTSISGKMYENTRQYLKELARGGIKGEAAKFADKQITSLYNLDELVKKNVEAVYKLQNKIAERGLLEKAGYTITKYADMLTGGTLRGLVGGILPRGKGYKAFNAIDLENALQKNLEIIQNAIKSKNDKDIINIIKKLNQ